MGQKNMIKIRYSSDETGWAEVLEGNKARIANVPMCDTLNLDDVVEFEEHKSGWPRVTRVIERAYPHKSCISYQPPTKETFRALGEALEAAGVKVEGMTAGLMMAAHAETFDASHFGKLAEKLGLQIGVEATGEVGRPETAAKTPKMLH